MSNYGNKKSVLQKANEAFRKVVTTTLAAGVFIGAPGYYQYGTIKQEDVKVVDYSFGTWDKDLGEFVREYKFKTNKGEFADKTSMLHFKGEADVQDIMDTIDKNKTYRITYYGIDFGPFERNILTAREVTAEELKAEAEAKKAAQSQTVQDFKSHAKDTTAAGQQQPQQAVTAGAQTSVLSGRVMTYDVVTADGKNSVQLTVPVEAVGKVTINAVTPIQIAPPSPQPPGP